MDILQELQRQQLNISPFTQNAIDKNGLGKINFRSAEMKYPDSLTLSFTVASSEGRGHEKHFTGNGQSIGFTGGYRVKIQFVNFGNFAPPNLLSLPLSQQVIYLKDIFDKADIKVSCDCGAWYWQGTSELLDRNPPEANYTGFTGQYGKGIWDTIHNTKNRICKHIHTVLENLESFIPKILKSINKGSSADSTNQQTVLVEPSQPAGTPETPRQGIEKTTTLNSEKAEDLENTTSKADDLNEPKADITKVKAKSHEKESDAISGPEKVEPPIEEITMEKEETPKENEEKDDMKKDLPEIRENKLKEISYINKDWNVNSPEDYEIWKEFQKTEAYMVVSFEEFKQDYLEYQKKLAKKNRRRRVKEELVSSDDLPDTVKDWLKTTKPSEERLEAINSKTGFRFVKDESYFHNLEPIMMWSDSYIMLDKENKPVGFLSPEVSNAEGVNTHRFYTTMFPILNNIEIEDSEEIISELHVFNFSDKISPLIVRDTCKFLYKALQKYPLIFWSVSATNPAKKMYDKMIDVFKGYSANWEEDMPTTYLLVQGISKIPSKYRESQIKSFGRILNENHDLSGIINSWEFNHLSEASKRNLLRSLLGAGLIASTALGPMSSSREIYKDRAPIEKSIDEFSLENEIQEDDWRYAPAIEKPEYQYVKPEIGKIIEKYRGDWNPETIETFLYAESKLGDHVKYDKQGAGIAQVSKILVDDYNKRHKTDYSFEEVAHNDDLNIKIGIWYLNFCKFRFEKNVGYEPDLADLYLMYNNGVKGYLNNRNKYKNISFAPYRNFLKSKDFIEGEKT
jgi:hypothetical protein